jgi:hypothetical protein
VDPRGAAVPGVRLSLAGAGDSTTDALGRATFTGVPEGPRYLSASEPWSLGYYPNLGTLVDLRAGTPTTSTLRLPLEPVRTVAIVGARMVPTDAERTRGRLTLEIVVLALDGTFDASLAPSQVRAFVTCPMGCAGGVDGPGGDLSDLQWASEPSPSVTLLPANAPRRVAVAALVDDSAAMGSWDPTRLRVPALKALAAGLASQPLALATFRAGTPSITTVAPYTTDAAQLSGTIDAVGTTPAGASALYPALGEMASYVAARAPAGHARAIAVLTAQPGRCADADSYTAACRDRRDASVREARNAGASVWIVGPEVLPSEAAVLAGGGYVKVEGPRRYAQALAALPKLLDGSTMRYRLEFDVRSYGPSNAGVPDAFRPGGMLLGGLEIAFTPLSRDTVPLAVPITAP